MIARKKKTLKPLNPPLLPRSFAFDSHRKSSALHRVASAFDLFVRLRSPSVVSYEDASWQYKDVLGFEASLLEAKYEERSGRLWWNSESVSMDFNTELPRTLKGYTLIWVVVDRLTKSAHFIPGKSTYIAKMLVSLQSSGKDFSLPWARGSWNSHLHLMEFAYNNSYQATIDMAPFEALYSRCCRSLICVSGVRLCRADRRDADERHKDLEFDVGDMVFLKVAPMKSVLRFEKKGKLTPHFVGPFEILKQIGPVAYRLALPPLFSAVHDMFNVSMLRKYVAGPTHVVDFEPL
ncbi:ty3-gypsy retrotransposon protein [Cucumis melo var. makuwa]|uniref:Ty3-gypsy retrotransposon protein n=1 Tax=Cucumis melo var. makuwa TaxID=1194695 RepID=A0A5A7TWH7_CUCMM|nr:ty3-gypsy retrotransposon protein [Cucumis melo var. makuwa]